MISKENGGSREQDIPDVTFEIEHPIKAAAAQIGKAPPSV